MSNTQLLQQSRTTNYVCNELDRLIYELAKNDIEVPKSMQEALNDMKALDIRIDDAVNENT